MGYSMFQTITTYIKQDQLLKTILRDSGILYTAGAVSIALTFAQQLTTARFLGAADYGRFATVLGSVSLILLLVDFRTWEAGTKLLPIPLNTKNYTASSQILTWLLTIDLVTGLLGTCILFATARLLATYLLHAPELANLIRIYAVILPFRLLAVGVPTALLRLRNRFDWLALKSVVYSVCRLLLISGAAFWGFGLEGVLIGATIGELLNVSILLIMLHRLWRRETNSALLDFRRPERLRIIAKLMGDLWISASLKGLQTEAFLPIVALITSPTAVGVVRSGLDIAQLILKLIEPISSAIHPRIIELYEMNDYTGFKRVIKQATIVLACLTWPFFLILFLLGRPLLPALLGETYQGLIVVAIIITFGMSINATFIWLRPAILALDGIRTQNVISLALFIVLLLALLLLAPRYQAIGAAVSISGQIILYNAASLLIYFHQQKHLTKERL